MSGPREAKVSAKIYHNPWMDSSEAWVLLGMSLLVGVPSFLGAKYLAGASADFVPQQYAILLCGLGVLGLAGTLPAIQSLIFLGFLEFAVAIGLLVLPLVYVVSLLFFYGNIFSLSKPLGIVNLVLLLAGAGALWLWRNATWRLIWQTRRGKAGVIVLAAIAIGAGVTRAGSMAVVYYAWGVLSVLAGSVSVLSGFRRLPNSDDWLDPQLFRLRLPSWMVRGDRFRSDPAAWPSTSQVENPFLAAALLAAGLTLACGGAHNVTASVWAAAGSQKLHKQAVAAEFLPEFLGGAKAK